MKQIMPPAPPCALQAKTLRAKRRKFAIRIGYYIKSFQETSMIFEVFHPMCIAAVTESHVSWQEAAYVCNMVDSRNLPLVEFLMQLGKGTSWPETTPSSYSFPATAWAACMPVSVIKCAYRRVVCA